MAEVLYPLCAVVAWASVGYRVNDLRRDPNPALRALCAALACVALTATIAIPAVAAAVDELTGVPCLAILLAHIAIVLNSAAVLRLLLFWCHPPDHARAVARGLGPIYAATVAALIILFLLARIDRSVASLAGSYALRPYVTQYLLLYLSAMAVAQAAIARLGWRYARLVHTPWLRRGLRTTVAGAIAGMGFAGGKGAYVTGLRFGVELSAAEVLAPLFASTSGMLLVAGLTLPAWGPRAAGLAAACARYRAYRQLAPLWLALYRTMPEIALVPPSRRDWLARDVGFRLYRRVIEIRDGRLALRPYFDDRVAGRARLLGRAVGLSGRNLDAAVEAAVLAAALRAAGAGPAVGARPVADRVRELDAPGGADLSDEVDWLGRVSTAFARSPVVEAVLAGTAPGRPALPSVAG